MHGPAGTQCRTISLNRILYLYVVAVVVWLVVYPAAAHAPSDMSLSYNELSKELVVTITHQVSNPQAHYIREVRVLINVRVIYNSQYSSQPASDSFTYTYPVQPIPGDTIEATAFCSITGSISRQMYMPGPTATVPSQPPLTQKAASGILPMLGALLVILGIWRK
jgi:hypothetical protein